MYCCIPKQKIEIILKLLYKGLAKRSYALRVFGILFIIALTLYNCQ